MQTKVFEIVFGAVGSEVYWTVMATLFTTRDCTNDEGDSIEHTGRKDTVCMVRIDGAAPDPVSLYFSACESDGSVKKVHEYIINNFRFLTSGSTIDMRHAVTKELMMPRLSQRAKQARAALAKKFAR